MTDDQELTAEDLALLGDDDAEDAGEEDSLDGPRRLLESGHFNIEEVRRHYGLSDEEVAELTAPKPTVASIDVELAKLAALRKTDSRAYWGDEVQKREQELIGLREQIKAPPAKAEASPKADADADSVAETDLGTQLDGVKAELEKLAELRKSDPKAYWKEDTQARERELLETKGQLEAAADQVERLTETVSSILDAVDDAEAFTAGFDKTFAALDEGSRQVIQLELASPPPDPVRGASDAGVRNFASTPEGAELVAEWGRQAPRKIAIIRERIEKMAVDDSVGQWFDGLSSKDAKAVLRRLAG